MTAQTISRKPAPTQTAKPAPATPTTPTVSGRVSTAHRRNAPAPAFDYTALTPVDAAKSALRAESKPNPFGAWLMETYSTDTPKTVPVPNANLAEAKGMLRRAANDNNIGVRIGEATNGNGTTNITFMGRPRKMTKKEQNRLARLAKTNAPTPVESSDKA